VRESGSGDDGTRNTGDAANNTNTNSQTTKITTSARPQLTSRTNFMVSYHWKKIQVQNGEWIEYLVTVQISLTEQYYFMVKVGFIGLQQIKPNFHQMYKHFNFLMC